MKNATKSPVKNSINAANDEPSLLTQVVEVIEGSPRLRYALDYAQKLGWAVFPCHTIINGACSCGKECKSQGKHPMTKKGVLDATTDNATITAWWTQNPQANIGVATGKVSGIFVVDVDNAGEKMGDYELDLLELEVGKFPDTAMAITGSGGFHYVFNYPPVGEIKNSAGTKLGNFIDVRGDNGYIIVEPSLHISGGAYAWEGSSDPLEDCAIADAPAKLLEMG
jgi:hypothetical protein